MWPSRPSAASSACRRRPSTRWRSGYLVSLAVFIPAAGWLGDRFGSKRVLLFAIAVFTGASALCGLADSLSELVLFRVVQGIGGGMLTPVGHGHAVPHLPARGTGAGVEHPDRAHRGGPGPRARSSAGCW